MTPQIDVQDLSALIQTGTTKVVDGSWAIDGTDMSARYREAHIPGAQFFNIEAVSDHTTDLPHMAPTAQDFAEAVGQLGISNSDHVVVYDQAGLFSAARVWWTFRLMGHERVQVLRGGLPSWLDAGLPVETGVPTAVRTTYTADVKVDKVIALSRLRKTSDEFMVLDARSRPRFEGTAAEPRAGLRSGHIPGSRNLPFPDLIRDGSLKPRDELLQIFADLGVTPQTAVVTSCGSGVTAAIISLALEEIGHTHSRLYDGSWAEWGQTDRDTPVATGEL